MIREINYGARPSTAALAHQRSSDVNARPFGARRRGHEERRRCRVFPDKVKDEMSITSPGRNMSTPYPSNQHDATKHPTKHQDHTHQRPLEEALSLEALMRDAEAAAIEEQSSNSQRSNRDRGGGGLLRDNERTFGTSAHSTTMSTNIKHEQKDVDDVKATNDNMSSSMANQAGRLRHERASFATPSELPYPSGLNSTEIATKKGNIELDSNLQLLSKQTHAQAEHSTITTGSGPLAERLEAEEKALDEETQRLLDMLSRSNQASPLPSARNSPESSHSRKEMHHIQNHKQKLALQPSETNTEEDDQKRSVDQLLASGSCRRGSPAHLHEADCLGFSYTEDATKAKIFPVVVVSTSTTISRPSSSSKKGRTRSIADSLPGIQEKTCKLLEAAGQVAVDSVSAERRRIEENLERRIQNLHKLINSDAFLLPADGDVGVAGVEGRAREDERAREQPQEDEFYGEPKKGTKAEVLSTSHSSHSRGGEATSRGRAGVVRTTTTSEEMNDNSDERTSKISPRPQQERPERPQQHQQDEEQTSTGARDELARQIEQLQTELDRLRGPVFEDVPKAFQMALELVSQHGCSELSWAEGFSAMHWAAQGNRTDVIDYLLQQAGGPELLALRDKNGKIPFEYAKEAGHDGLCAYLQTLGAAQAQPLSETLGPELPDAYREVLRQVETDGWSSMRWQADYSLLHWAAKKGVRPLVEYLVHLGADVNVADKIANRSPLDYASDFGHFEICDFLQGAGALPRVKRLANKEAKSVEGMGSKSQAAAAVAGEDGDDASTSGGATHLQADAGSRGARSLGETIEEKKEASTPSLTLSKQHEELPKFKDRTSGDESADLRREVATLIARDLCDGDGHPGGRGSHRGGRKANPSILFGSDLLLTSSEDIEPHLLGIAAPYLDAIAQVAKRGWNRMKWANGFTLLHWAARSGHVELCRYFLHKGADPNIRDDFTRSPVDYARRKNHMDALRLLLLEADSRARAGGVE
ncbi:unnamed protein product [Amoebophrya sp. A25]|nr:unnamed protein product [Amoebophrya sp. A25]|eukprot:GSA25T00021375001.1